MNNRYIGALLILPFLICLFLPGIVFKFAIMILAIIALNEFNTALKQYNINVMTSISYLLAVVYFFGINNMDFLKYTMLLLSVAIFLMFCYAIIFLKYNFVDISATIFGFIYIPVFFSFIYLVRMKHGGEFLVWLIFITSWLSDTAAYYSGRFFGKHKLIPEISPKKTVEGAIGGLVGSLIGTVIFGFIISYFHIHIPIYHYIILGLLAGAASQFGDLTASSIKRTCNIKDFGKLIPGHGGVLDRFDSILFAAFVVYYYITFVVHVL